MADIACRRNSALHALFLVAAAACTLVVAGSPRLKALCGAGWHIENVWALVVLPAATCAVCGLSLQGQYNTLRLHARQVTRHDARLAGFANLTMVQVGRAELEAACVHCRRWIGTAALRAGTVLVRLSAMPCVGWGVATGWRASCNIDTHTRGRMGSATVDGRAHGRATASADGCAPPLRCMHASGYTTAHPPYTQG
jgi:hypothetical protein